MRITEISIEGLFSIFNHPIALNQEERITIIYGLNGFGKTSILRVIDGVFNTNYSAIRSIPFKKFDIKFDDKSILSIVKANPKKNGKSEIEVSLAKGKDTKKFQLKPISKEDINFPVGRLEALVPNLERVGSSTWVDYITGERLELEDVFNRYSNYFPKEYFYQMGLFDDVEARKNPEWFIKLIRSIDVHFIKTERLHMIVNADKRFREKGVSLQSVVSKYSNELKHKIGERIREYASLSQSLDSSFPIRLVKEKSHNLEDEELRNKLQDIERKSNDLTSAGLLDKNQKSEVPTEFNQTNKMALALYAEDNLKKLGVFDDIAEKVEIFKESINNRFQYKKISVNKDSGITFTTNDNQDLSLESLSSGEQHELVLFYEFLFNVKPNSLVLIDEPEISLHVAWQAQFLKDLQKVTENAKFDVLLATHSPQIIADRWDLTVELKGIQPSPSANGNKRKAVKKS
jgi:predicted ATP-binding protein involved in virulence